MNGPSCITNFEGAYGKTIESLCQCDSDLCNKDKDCDCSSNSESGDAEKGTEDVNPRTYYPVPKIIIRTGTKQYADTNDDLYLKVCATNTGFNCCKQTLKGPFIKGGMDEFPFESQFQQCLENATMERGHYMIGLVGIDGWQQSADGIEIFSDQAACNSQVCTLDPIVNLCTAQRPFLRWLDGNEGGVPEALLICTCCPQ